MAECGNCGAVSDTGPCADFATVADVQHCPGCDTLTEAEIEWALPIASRAAYLATARQFGVCTLGDSRLRPCARSACGLFGPTWGGADCCTSWGWWWSSYLESWGTCGCLSDCCCVGAAEIDLGYTIYDIDEIKIDGVVFPAANYRVDERRWLVRTDGGVWPATQDLTLADTEVGIWSIDLSYGIPPPALVVAGTAALACELAKACAGLDCALPDTTVAVTRQGHTVQLLSLAEVIAAGGTGVRLFDLMVAFENPHRLRNDAYAIDLDDHQHRRAGPA